MEGGCVDGRKMKLLKAERIIQIETQTLSGNFEAILHVLQSQRKDHRESGPRQKQNYKPHLEPYSGQCLILRQENHGLERMAILTVIPNISPEKILFMPS